jgi:valyl-tRNA synthetase
LAKAYDPAAVERDWNGYWAAAVEEESARRVRVESGGAGSGVCAASRPAYSIVFPPPNITGALHIGHALTTAVEDALVRWRRMMGDDVLFLPGLDHAGIATQTVVERQLLRQGGPAATRRALGRDRFVAEVAKWAEEYGARIRGQLTRLGASFDWRHEAYTLDAPRSAAVTEAFVRLYEEGRIYRASASSGRLVHWCPALRTVLSDIEVDARRVEGPTRILVPTAAAAAAAAPAGKAGGATGEKKGGKNAAASVNSGKREVEVGVMHLFAYPLVRTDAPMPDLQALAQRAKEFDAAAKEAAVAATEAQQAPEQGQGQGQGQGKGQWQGPAPFPTALPGLRDAPHLVVGTTRLETMLGDCAVAVHPTDPRYAHLFDAAGVAQWQAVHPVTLQRLPIVRDAELVDPALGTGAVKVTPAHDANDLQCAIRHALPVQPILEDDGTLSARAGPRYAGMDRFDARALLAADLEAIGLFGGVRANPMSLALCSRSGDILEPMLKPQWYVQLGRPAASPATTAAAPLASVGLAELASSLVRRGALALLPRAYEREWFGWLDSGRTEALAMAGAEAAAPAQDEAPDWCISRQLWWGHRIPAWRVVQASAAGQQQQPKDEESWIVARNSAEAESKARARYGDECLSSGRVALEQDEDVLDTWFSSGLFPLSVLGWPHAQSAGAAGGKVGMDPAMSRFYPFSVMETGGDIIFFWVARMAMLCTHLLGQETTAKLGTNAATAATLADTCKPFKRVFLHPVVRDKAGKKMSKSTGNVIDPLQVMDGVPLEALVAQAEAASVPPAEIKRAVAQLKKDFPKGIPPCGSDALRFALALYMQGHAGDGHGSGVTNAGINLDLTRVQGARLFCNKMWNATRFALSHVAEVQPAEIAAIKALAAQQSPVFPSHLGLSALPLIDPTTAPAALFSLSDRWILARLAQTIARVNDGFQKLDLGSAAEACHSFFLDEFCDVYIEASKSTFSANDLTGTEEQGIEAKAWVNARKYVTRSILGLCVDASLRLFHPFMPFLTEELWQRAQMISANIPADTSFAASKASAQSPSALLFAPFPTPSGAWVPPVPSETNAADSFPAISRASSLPVSAFASEEAVSDMEAVLATVRAIRSLKKTSADIFGSAAATGAADADADISLTASAVRTPSNIYIDGTTAHNHSLFVREARLVASLARVPADALVSIAPTGALAAALPPSLQASIGSITVSLPIPTDRGKARDSLSREVQKQEQRLSKQRAVAAELEERWTRERVREQTPGAARMPAEVVAAEQQRLEAARGEVAATQHSLRQLQQLLQRTSEGQ